MTDDLASWLLEQNQWTVDTVARRLYEVDREAALLVLRECEARRRIVARHAPRKATHGDMEGLLICGCSPGMDEFLAMEWPCDDVRNLASVYADRPGYRSEWAP